MIPVWAIAFLGIPPQSVLAEATSAADLFVKTCLASVDDLAKVDAMATENKWRADSDHKLAFPLGKRGDALKRRSGWQGTWNGKEFVIVTGTETTPYDTTNACMIMFRAGGKAQDFVARVAASVGAVSAMGSAAPWEDLGIYEVLGGRSAKPRVILVESNDGDLAAAWAIQEVAN
jgi:hypothetical protein